jgi:hypothetical protein
MKLKDILTAIHFILLCAFFGFSQSASSQSNPYFKENNPTEVQDSIMVINDSKIRMKSIKSCKSNVKDRVDNDFLNTNIQYFNIDVIDKKQLSKEIYYRNFLTKTHFLEFEESDFYKENFTFSLIQKSIKNYGKCYIGKYYFPNATNSSQRRTTVIINIDKNEISIWDFDDVNIIKEGLKCDFSVRGKHTIYRLIYSSQCKIFIKS